MVKHGHSWEGEQKIQTIQLDIEISWFWCKVKTGTKSFSTIFFNQLYFLDRLDRELSSTILINSKIFQL